MNPDIEQTIHCPICKSLSIKRHYSFNDMTIYKCHDCSMMFQDPQQMAKLLLNYNNSKYDQYFTCSNLANIIADKSLMRLKLLLKNNLNNKNILEIGTGKGVLASLLLQNKANYSGIEPSPIFFQDILSHHCPELTKVVQNCTLDEAKLQKKYYDLVIIIDSLEHIPNPKEFLIRLKTYMKPSGLLYVEVPNESLLYFKGFLRSHLKTYAGYPTHIEHVNLFTRKTLLKLFKDVNMKINHINQISILGDQERMKIISNNKAHPLIAIISTFFKITKLDLLFRQGNLSASAIKA